MGVWFFGSPRAWGPGDGVGAPPGLLPPLPPLPLRGRRGREAQGVGPEGPKGRRARGPEGRGGRFGRRGRGLCLTRAISAACLGRARGRQVRHGAATGPDATLGESTPIGESRDVPEAEARRPRTPKGPRTADPTPRGRDAGGQSPLTLHSVGEVCEPSLGAYSQGELNPTLSERKSDVLPLNYGNPCRVSRVIPAPCPKAPCPSGPKGDGATAPPRSRDGGRPDLPAEGLEPPAD